MVATASNQLTVLWVGNVVLAKGIAYLLEAVRRLRDERIRFVVAGPVGISRAVVEGAPRNVKFLGRVNRSEVHRLYAAADVFVFPSLSDGFGIAQVEALAHGVPVIATGNCGEVVTDGVDGLLIPAADSEALAAAIARLQRNRAELDAMRFRARLKLASFSIPAFVDRLERAASGAGEPSGPRRWVVAQVGAREHYAIARGFHRVGRLHRLYTDAWCRHGAAIVSRLPGRLGAFGGRFDRELARASVRAFTLRSLLREAQGSGRPNPDAYVRAQEAGCRFATWVARDLARVSLDRSDAFFAYSAGALETLEHLRERGVRCVVGQVDAAREHEATVLREVERWPGWQPAPRRVPDAFWERLSCEWELADLVVVNSTWSRSALVRQGVPEEKIAIVPVAYEPAVGTAA